MKSVLLFSFLVLSLLLQAETAPAQVNTPPTDFIRVQRTDREARLQTSVTTYQKGDLTVDLLGAIHIADAQYYQALNKLFRNYEVLLFELIGGEDAHKFMDGKPKEAAKDGRPAEGLRALYGSFAKSMQLAQQVNLIDYTPANFIHADFTRAEYAKATASQDGDLIGFALETAVNQSKITGKPFGGMDPGLLFRAMLSGDGSGLKLELMKGMESGDEAAADLTGGNLIIEERNEKCLQILDEQIKAGKTHLGIFYGAAHNPDFEKRLHEKGFKKTNEEWLTAWSVKSPKIK